MASSPNRFLLCTSSQLLGSLDGDRRQPATVLVFERKLVAEVATTFGCAQFGRLSSRFIRDWGLVCARRASTMTKLVFGVRQSKDNRHRAAAVSQAITESR